MPSLSWSKAESCFSRELAFYGLFSSWICEINSEGLTDVTYVTFQGEIPLLIHGSWFGMGFSSFFFFF